jgi:folate-dependent phosphoribosylglycinamide formyltransferase PurN
MRLESDEAQSLTKKSAQLFFLYESVVKSSVTLRKQLIDVLNQHDIDMIVHSGLFYEVDAVKRIRVADQLINIHIFSPK